MIYFRCELSQKIGWGHFKRCLALAEVIQHNTDTCFLIVDPTNNVKSDISAIGSHLHSLPSDLTYLQEIQHYPQGAQNIILDLGHRKNLEQPESFIDYLQALADHGFKVIIIDGLDDDSFRDDRAPKVKAYVQPYWGVAENKPPHAEHWLYGKDYVLLDKDYKGAFKLKDNTGIQNILITFGGADPQGNTLKAVKGICAQKADDLSIRVIIGPSFQSEQISKLEEIAQEHASIELIFSPNSLRPHYQWADLGLCGSGSSRYEAAACGLPLNFAAIYPEHTKLSETFSTYKTAQYIGFGDDLTPEDWQKSVFSLRHNPEGYINMLNAIKDMRQDDFGTEKLAQDILAIFEE